MSSFWDRVDPELLPGLAYSEAFPPPLTLAELAEFRARAEAPAAAVLPAGVEVRDVSADGTSLRVFTPSGPGPHPAVFWLHGGGMIAGSVELDTVYCAALCARTAAVVVAVDYRLAPEHPFPAALEDALAGLQWLLGAAEGLGVDPQRVALAGSSAGAGLATGLALLHRDRSGPPLAYLYLMYPMLDPTHSSGSAREFTSIPTWNRAHSEFAWNCYLGAAASDPSAYAAPALAQDLSGLPATLIQTGELDLFRDEDIAFAVRLLQAGVPAELHVYPGAYHGFELNCPDSAAGSQCLRDRDRALNRALHGTSSATVPAPGPAPAAGVTQISTPSTTKNSAEGSLI
ncbi:alpha/beta hydrolase [Arthrobacter sp. Sa2CUA1]|uniref:Alpha/beta hydrolase n=1 Tax=Arthrobacter gallicola TaxID=2762225 RepID=A0ABR8UUV7_9MICC|nr:alpha/beta hydrolase [Arthrobacter gallicola]MBD7996349.1 alpha/beta hydrolase [Arthrobacter gallicola]